MAEVIPGTISNPIPASAIAFASSAPRPKTNGSPPFNRTTCFFDQERINFLLTQRVCARSFSDINDLRAVSRPAQHLRICQVIVNDHIRLLDTLLGAQCHQTKIAWSGADQINFPALAFTSTLVLSLARHLFVVAIPQPDTHSRYTDLQLCLR